MGGDNSGNDHGWNGGGGLSDDIDMMVVVVGGS